MTARILVLDDETHWRNLLHEILQGEGYDVTSVATGTEALRAIKNLDFDLVILDVQLKDQQEQGLDVCLEIRQQPEYIPIIMISGVKKEMVDRVVGLRVGADLYLEKPVESHEIIAQVYAVLRMAKRLNDRKQSAGWQHIDEHFSINFERRAVLIAGEQIELTVKEYELLRYLVERAGKPCSRSDIIDKVWAEDNPNGVSNAAVDTIVSRLRQKIELPEESEPQYVLTIHGLGYKFRDF